MIQGVVMTMSASESRANMVPGFISAISGVQYTLESLKELRRLTDHADSALLCYLISMAIEEADYLMGTKVRDR